MAARPQPVKAKLKNRDVLIILPDGSPIRIIAADDHPNDRYVTFVDKDGRVTARYGWANIAGFAYPDLAQPKGREPRPQPQQED